MWSILRSSCFAIFLIAFGGSSATTGCLRFYLTFLEIAVVGGKNTHLAFLGISGGLSPGFGAGLGILLIENGEVLFVDFGFDVRFPVSYRLGEGAGRMVVFERGGGQQKRSVIMNFFVHEFY